MPEAAIKFVKPERLWLKDRVHQTLDERWVQSQIAEDPAILGLGDLILKDKERIQPRAGRLDLLLEDADTHRRYEVEVQLGRSDESHIIRTVEYWDIERKRYPQYDHCAVIVAEDITSRFLNVVSLFNGSIPLIAIQMSALRFGDQVGLVFTTVMDELQRGLVDEDEELAEATDRTYWENKGTRETVGMADRLMEIIKGFDPGIELKYNKLYIGLAKDGQPNNFAIFRAKKNYLRLEVRIEPSEEAEKLFDGLEMMDYDKRWRYFRVRLTPAEIKDRRPLLEKVLKRAYDESRP